MVSINNFTGGLNSDFNPMSQPENTYLEAINMYNAGDLFALGNEPGNQKIIDLPFGMKIIGHWVFDDSVALFLTDNVVSQIGIVDLNTNTYSVKLNNPGLNFKTSNQIDCQGRRLFDGDRIVYFTDNLNEPRQYNLDFTYTGNVLEQMSLFSNYAIPICNFNGLQDGGNHQCGVYQFAARYLNENLDPSPFGFVCNPISLVNDAEGTPRNAYDGGNIDELASKRIVLSIDNIDTDFFYVELARIRYEGQASVPVVEVIKRREINQQSTIDLTLLGNEEVLEELAIDDIFEVTAIYNTAKCIEQKDGRLFLSNLTADPIDYDLFQTVANNIRVDYEIEARDVIEVATITPTPGTTTDSEYTVAFPATNNLDYNSPGIAFDEKTYRRGEVYSLGISFIFKNGAETPVFHIPARDDGFPNQLAIWTSSEQYPSDFPPLNDGTILANTDIRHHLMPSLDDEPHYDVNGVRLIKLNFFQINLSQLGPQAANITGYRLHRQLRNTDANRSVYAQGVMHPHYRPYLNDHSPDTNSDVYTNYGLPSGTGLVTNIMYPNGIFGNTEHDSLRTDLDATTIERSYIAYLSPDLYLLNRKDYQGFTVRPELRISGEVDYLLNDSAGNYDKDQMFFFCKYDEAPASVQLDAINNQILYNYDVEQKAIAATSTPGNLQSPLSDPSYYIMASRSNGYRMFELDSDCSYPSNDMGNPNLTGYNVRLWNSSASNQTDVAPDHTGSLTSYRYLYNIISVNPAQYGAVTEGDFAPILYQDTSVDPFGSYNNLGAFNGDTFISLYSHLFTTTAHTAVTGSTANDAYAAIRSIAYFYVESEVNCNYRHRPINTNDGTQGVPYYPNVPDGILTSDDNLGGIFDIDPILGPAQGYNLQYSFDNSLKPNFAVPFGFTSISDYPNRTIYSEQSFEGERSDRYRKFLVNSYHDIPKHRGPIWDTFVFNGILYLHTTKSLWRTYVNQREMLQGNASQIYVGTGGLFPSPSKETLTIDGGYAGTQSQWAGTTTPYGYFFVDAERKRVYMLQQQLQDITPGMINFFNENLNVPVDRPVEFRGLTSVWDNELKRLILTNHDDDFTLSYSFYNNKWVSFHDYRPGYYLEFANNLWSQRDENIYEQNSGNYGEYYDVVNPSSLKYVINDKPTQSKVFDNAIIYSETTKSDDSTSYIRVREDCFSTAQLTTEFQNTGEFDLVFQDPDLYVRNIRFVENKYQIVFPRNLINKDLAEVDVLDNSILETQEFKDRLRGSYMIADYEYDNTNNWKFILNSILTSYRPSYR